MPDSTKRLDLSFGSKILLLYLVASYTIPFLAIHITGFDSAYYKYPSLSAPQFIYGLLIFGAVVLAAVSGRKGPAGPRISIKPPPFPFQLGLLIILDIFAAAGYVDGLGGWRYQSTGLSENLSFTSLFYVLAQQIFEFMVFLEIFLFGGATGADFNKRRIITLLLALGLLLVASGLGPMITAMVVFLYVIFPRQFQLLIFRENVSGAGSRVGVKLGLVPMIAVGFIALVAALVLGEQIKSGVDSVRATDNLLETNGGDYLGYVIERFSTAEYSLRVALADYATLGWDKVASNFWAPIGNFLFRMDALTGGVFGMNRPYAGSLMRLNYEMINYYPFDPRQGTSPGLIAGFVMSFPIPIAIIAASTYVLIVKWILNNIGRGIIAHPTFFGVALGVYFLGPLFVSPIDLLLILDNGFFAFLLFLGLAFVVRAQARKVSQHAIA